MKLGTLLLALSTATLAACSGADIGEGVLGDDDDGGGGSSGDGGASGQGTQTSGPRRDLVERDGVDERVDLGPRWDVQRVDRARRLDLDLRPGRHVERVDRRQRGLRRRRLQWRGDVRDLPRRLRDVLRRVRQRDLRRRRVVHVPAGLQPAGWAGVELRGRGLCPPDPCEAGGAVDATCPDPCVMIVCIQDPTCCEGTWSQTCADYAESFTELGFCTCG